MKVYSTVQELTLRINGEERTVIVRPSDTLLRTLRGKLGLTGTKIGCEHGDCGACTVQINGKPVKSCLVLAVEMVDKEITTIEGLENDRLKQSFVHNHGFQCGFCTSGMLMNADALLHDHPDPTDEEVKMYLESNLCRCTGYEGIEMAVTDSFYKKKDPDSPS